MKNHPMMWRVLSLVVALFAALSLTFAPVFAPDYNLAPVYADEDDDDDDGGRLDFGFIVSTVSSNPAGGFLQGFITTTIRAERGRVFRGAQSFFTQLPAAPGSPATFEWVASRRRKRSARSDTLLQLSNLHITETITIERQYIDQDGVNCTKAGLSPIDILPQGSVIIVVSNELEPSC